MKHLIILLLFLNTCCPIFAQAGGFFVSKRYAKHFAEGRNTGKSEVAFFGVSLIQQDSCWIARQYRGINTERFIYPDYVREQQYCWDKELKKYSASCERQTGGGLFRHQHTEGQDWIELIGEDSLQLKRCGYARAVNTLIRTDSSQYFSTK